jgi:hypothetical protein
MEKKERRSKAGFYRWLAQQSHREDRVGMLSREVADPRHWLARLLFSGPDAREIAHAAAKAMYEYDRQLGGAR